MRKIGFITLGCKVNIYESNAVKNLLEQRGYKCVEPDSSCCAFVINTCSVTNQSDAKSRKMINKCKKLNEDAIICVMGCYSQTNKEALTIDGVDILVGNGNKLQLVEKLCEKLVDKSVEKYVNILDILNHHEYENLNVNEFDHTRAFVKIEDGCENFCTYCIIPFARGPVRCKDSDNVIKELSNIANMGYKEVVLSGIHTGRYFDQVKNLNLSGLVKRILNEVPNLERIRLSSIEINEIDDEFIEIMKNSKVIANHLHLPLQSGSDTVLKMMERRYDSTFFKQKVEKIRSVRPDISLSTDVIVGFPYETKEEYEISKKFIEEINFSKLHVFPYSKRSGTKACLMPQVKDFDKKQRALDLIKLSDKLEEDYASRFVGSILEVIVEKKYDDASMVGHSSNFLLVKLPLDETKITKNVKVKVVSVDGKMVNGILI